MHPYLVDGLLDLEGEARRTSQRGGREKEREAGNNRCGSKTKAPAQAWRHHADGKFGNMTELTRRSLSVLAWNPDSLAGTASNKASASQAWTATDDFLRSKQSQLP